MTEPVRMASCHPDRPHKAHDLCDNCYTAARREKNPDRARKCVWANRWAKALKTTTALFLEWYENLFQEQGGVCAICEKQCTSRYRLSVDHDHTTGQLRGLLCSECNLGIGKLEDNPALLRKAANYLEKYQDQGATRPTPGGLP